MQLTPKYGTTEDAKQTTEILKNFDKVCQVMGMKKQVQVISCEEDEYNADYLEFTVTGRPEVDTPILKFCNQNKIKLALNTKGSEYLSRLLADNNIMVEYMAKPEEQPGLGMSFTYVPAEGADDAEVTISQLEMTKDGVMDFDGYEQEYKTAKKWVDEHPGSYIKSGESIIYRGNVYQILGQLSLLDGAEKDQATSVFD